MIGRLFWLSCALCAWLAISFSALGQLPNPENHYTFDDKDNLGFDSSGNNRDGELVDDTGDVQWIDDPARGGVIEFPGSNLGYIMADIPQLPGDGFTITLWAYRDPDLCCDTSAGGNDGFFQVQLDGDAPSGQPADKIIGGWVQKSDAAVWGRLHDEFLTRVNLDNVTFFMEDEKWTHFAYRGNGSEFELIVNGESGVGPVAFYDGTLAEHNRISIGKQGTETWGGRLDDFRVYSVALTDEQIKEVMMGTPPVTPGDFNSDGVLDAADINLLTTEVRKGMNPAEFDLDNNALVNQEDRRVWVEDLKNTYFGDANLDLEFNTTDLVAIFQAGEYEDAIAGNSEWETGDWSGDGDFDTSDLVLAFQGGGFEKGPRAAAAVPEPSAAILSVLAAVAIAAWGRLRLRLTRIA